MVIPGEIHVWGSSTAHALASLLNLALGHPTSFVCADNGKPYLNDSPRIRFNIAHTSGLSVIALALEAEVGIDVERLRPMPEWREIALQYFPHPDVRDEREFFRQWVRFEAQAKARGTGLLSPPVPCPFIADIDLGPEFACAVAATAPRMRVRVQSQ